MANVLWSDELSAGIQEIDVWHKEFIDLINELYDGMRNRMGHEEIIRIPGRMIKFAASHFGTEEIYMVKFDYPDYQVHREEHLNFYSRVIVVIYDCKKGDAIVSIEMLKFLKDWLVNHIQVTDKKILLSSLKRVSIK